MQLERSDETQDRSDELDEARRRIAELEQRLASVRAEQAVLAESEARFRILSELIADCCWARWVSSDGTTHRVWVNDAFESLTGYSLEEFEEVGREGLVHPDDLEAALQYVDGPPGISEHEFRIIRKDGQVRWLRERMQVERIGDTLQVLGATQDVTAQKEAEEILRRGNRLLEERVQERTRELKDANRRLMEEVRVRQETEGDLRQARDAAQAASQAKSRFLANMSHEIRTPLNGVLGIVGLLGKQDLPASARPQMKMLKTSAESLLELVESVLDLAKIEADRLHLSVSDFSLGDLETLLICVLGQRAQAKGLDLQVYCDEDVPDRLRGDPARLRQVLLNLVDNAIKFTDQGGIQIDFQVHERQGERIRLRVTVRDTGIGIAPEIIEKLFEPFAQGDPSTARRFGGAGLGLAICRRLTALMGGEIDVHSNLGQGSVFTVTLPFEVPDGLSGAAGSSFADTGPVSSLPSGYRVLVAEDSSINQAVVALQLEALGVSCRVATGGAEALAASEEETYDLILMDCQMPGMDGYQATEAIRRQHSTGRRVPIIALTASAVREDLERCYEVGMDDILAKPYRERELWEMLRKWLPPEPAAEGLPGAAE